MLPIIILKYSLPVQTSALFLIFHWSKFHCCLDCQKIIYCSYLNLYAMCAESKTWFFGLLQK